MKISLTCMLVAMVQIGSGLLAQNRQPVIGQLLNTCTLPDANLDIRGLAFLPSPKKSPRLCVLDTHARITVFRTLSTPAPTLIPLKTIDIPPTEKGTRISAPRGLAAVVTGGETGFFTLEYRARSADSAARSRLWYFPAGSNQAIFADLTQEAFGIKGKEVTGLATRGERIYISHATTTGSGILVLRWPRPLAGPPLPVKHMPDSGKAPSLGLAFMILSETEYLWGTAGRDHLYVADAATGRGLFYFPMPGKSKRAGDRLDMAYTGKDLWISESGPGPDRIHRINVARNPLAGAAGPRQLRHLVMTITSRPERKEPHMGKVMHNFSRPYDIKQFPNQAIWLQTEKVKDLNRARNASVRKFHHDPAGDRDARQHMQAVEYGDAPARTYTARYEIDFMTRAYRKFVYPHLVNRNCKALEGTGYTADDADLYNLADRKTYMRFLDRVKAYINKKYASPVDMDNPYWSARNILEYIQDNYYYPVRDVGMPATVDYNNGHYDANPGNLKIALSDRPYDRTQIIACSGTSVMVAGAMRFQDIPARWLGTALEKGPKQWDHNGNGLLDADETAQCSNGHRQTQVWLGNNYGWIIFDATPSRPPENDFAPPPPAQSQWRFMNRAGAGLRHARRLVFNAGSGLFRPLYREFEYDAELAVNNNCGGDQRYNLQGRYEKPSLWRLPRHRIEVRNSCFITRIKLTGPKKRTCITWRPVGPWNRDPRGKISFTLQKRKKRKGKARKIKVLAADVPWSSRRIRVDLSGVRGHGYRIMIRKNGDPETGGHTGYFSL